MFNSITESTAQLPLEPATSFADEAEVPACHPLILERLPPGDLYNARLVCRVWNEIVTGFLKVTHLFPKTPFIGKRSWEAHVDLKKYGLECEQPEVPCLSKKHDWFILNQMDNESEQGISFVTLPKGLTLRKVIEVAGDPKRGNAMKIQGISKELIEEIGDVKIEKTVTVAVTNGPFKGTRGPAFCDQGPVINMRHNCSTPKALTLLTLAVMRFMISNPKEPVRILNEDPPIFIKCEEMSEGRQVVLGAFDQEGPQMYDGHPMGADRYALGGQRALENPPGK